MCVCVCALVCAPCSRSAQPLSVLFPDTFFWPPSPAPLQVACVCAFSQTLRRYTSLNHLAQAARAVLQNSTQITQMLSDLNRVDFTNVQVCCPVWC